MIDLKFEIKDGKIVNRVSGAEVPEDEPLFLLRARDQLAVLLLNEYLEMAVINGCDATHITAIEITIQRFQDFAHLHPERMKQPGITREVKLPEAG